MSRDKHQRAGSGKGSRCLAIDLDADGLIVASGTGSRVEQALAWVPGDEHGPPPLSPETAEQLGEGLRQRLKAAGIAAAPALVCIGRDKVILKELKHPVVDAAHEPDMIRFQALKELTESPDEIVIDYVPLSSPPPGDPEAEARSMAVVVRKDYFDSIRALVEAAGLKLAAVTPRPFAVAAALADAIASGRAHPLETPAGAAAIATLGPQGGEFTVVQGGIVRFTRAIPAQAIAVEALLLAEVKRNLTTYEGQNQDYPLGAVYVPEAENDLAGWGRRLRGLPIAVQTFDPLGNDVANVRERQRGRFCGAAGLLAARAAGLPINFASPRQPIVKTDPRKVLLLSGGLAALVLLLVGGVAGYMALDAADTKLAARQGQKNSIETLLAATEMDRKRVDAAEKWEARGVNYLDELFDLSDRLPPGDSLRVSRILGSAIRVDKSGKQKGQAFFVLTTGSRTPTAAADLVTAIDRDNLKGHRFYSGTSKTVGGADSHGITHGRLATITTTVMHRSPNQYTRHPMFQAPRRGGVVLPAPAKQPR